MSSSPDASLIASSHSVVDSRTRVLGVVLWRQLGLHVMILHAQITVGRRIPHLPLQLLLYQHLINKLILVRNCFHIQIPFHFADPLISPDDS